MAPRTTPEMRLPIRDARNTSRHRLAPFGTVWHRLAPFGTVGHRWGPLEPFGTRRDRLFRWPLEYVSPCPSNSCACFRAGKTPENRQNEALLPKSSQCRPRSSLPFGPYGQASSVPLANPDAHRDRNASDAHVRHNSRALGLVSPSPWASATPGTVILPELLRLTSLDCCRTSTGLWWRGVWGFPPRTTATSCCPHVVTGGALTSPVPSSLKGCSGCGSRLLYCTCGHALPARAHAGTEPRRFFRTLAWAGPPGR